MSFLDSCHACGRPVQLPTLETRTFTYGEDKVQLCAKMYIYNCTVCDIEFTDHQEHISRHLAICSHLGILPPRAILTLRGERQMTQKTLARIMGVDPDRVLGWEFGTIMQTPEQDKHLRRIFAQTPIPDET